MCCTKATTHHCNIHYQHGCVCVCCRPLHVFSCGRNSPIWSVSKAQGNMTQETIDRLATPKPVTQSVPEALITGRYSVSPSAMKANASRRVRQLSKAKNRPDGPYRDPQWPVSTRTCTAVARKYTYMYRSGHTRAHTTVARKTVHSCYGDALVVGGR